MAELRIFLIGNGGGDMSLRQHRRCMAAGEGMVAQAGEKLRPERGKFYVDNRVKSLVHSGGVNTAQ